MTKLTDIGDRVTKLRHRVSLLANWMRVFNHMEIIHIISIEEDTMRGAGRNSYTHRHSCSASVAEKNNPMGLISHGVYLSFFYSNIPGTII